jgi:hypothetical protein
MFVGDQRRGFALLPRVASQHGKFQNSAPPASAWRFALQWQALHKEIRLAEDKTYKAEYLGSGTFAISKPKRTKAKRRQTRLKNPQRGARK